MTPCKNCHNIAGKVAGGVTSRAVFYYMQHFGQQKDCETTNVTLCNSPATCLTMALQDKLLRKLLSVTAPLQKNKIIFPFCTSRKQ